MDKESRDGLMGQYTLENGARTELMAKASSFMLMATSMMDFGQMIKRMVMECTSMSTVLSTKDSGRMICSMDLVLKLGLMAPDTKVITLKEERMVLDHTNGMMDHSTQVIGWKTRLVESVYILG